MRGLLGSFLWGVFAAIWSLGLMPFFVSTHGVGLVIPSLVLLRMGSRFSRVFVFAMSVGVVLDSYALNGWQFHTVRLVLLAGVGSFIFTQWLTNRSLYTAVVLAGFLTIIDQIWLISTYAMQGIAFRFVNAMHELGVALLAHVILVVVGFYCVSLFTKRFSISFGNQRDLTWYG